MPEVVKIQQKRQNPWLFPLLFGAALMGYTLLCPMDAAESIRSSSKVFISAVFPSLFAFSVAAKLLVKSGIFRGNAFSRTAAFFGLSPSGFAAVCIGFFAGFPTGAAVLSDSVKAGEMTKEEAAMFLPYVNLAGPAFLVGTVGCIYLDSPKRGTALLLGQTAAALFCIAAFTKRKVPTNMQPEKSARPPFGKMLLSSLAETAQSMLGVFSCIVFFSLLSDMVEKFLPFPVINALLCAMTELAGGAFAIAKLHLSPILQMVLLAFAVGFGGISVYFQVLSECERSNIPTSRYLFSRLFLAVCTAAFTLVFGILQEKYGLFPCILLLFLMALLLRVAKRRRNFPKGVEKTGGMLYNKGRKT